MLNWAVCGWCGGVDYQLTKFFCTIFVLTFNRCQYGIKLKGVNGNSVFKRTLFLLIAESSRVSEKCTKKFPVLEVSAWRGTFRTWEKINYNFSETIQFLLTFICNNTNGLDKKRIIDILQFVFYQPRNILAKGLPSIFFYLPPPPPLLVAKIFRKFSIGTW